MKIMKNAYKLPFYRKKFEECGLKPEDFRTAEDLVKFPVMTKEELREYMDAYLSEADHHKDWFVNKTSGSTGKPLSVIYSTKEIAVNRSIWMSVLKAEGYNAVTGKLLGLRGGIRHTGNNPDSFIQRLGLLRRKVVHYNTDPDIAISEINNYKPDLIYGPLSVLINIAHRINDANQPCHKPKLIGLIAEQMSMESIDYIRQTFSAKVFTAYGNEETGNPAYSLPDRPMEYLICSDTHVINLIDDAGHLSDKGRICITSLYQRTFPIINYDIGDSAEMIHTANGDRLTNIVGKVEQYLIFSDGTRVAWYVLYDVIENADYLLQCRFIQKSYDRLEILASLKPQYRDDYETIMSGLVDRVKDALKHPEMDVVYNVADVIPPDPNGKLRLLISEVT